MCDQVKALEMGQSARIIGGGVGGNVIPRLLIKERQESPRSEKGDGKTDQRLE